MKALVIVGSDFTTNSSANLCHRAYIQGLIDNGYEVDILSGGVSTNSKQMEISDHVAISMYTYEMKSIYEKLRDLIKSKKEEAVLTSGAAAQYTDTVQDFSAIGKMKRFIHSLYGPYEVYAAWKNRAIRFQSDENYELVFSLAFPPVSHLLAYELIKRKHVRCKRWIQLWEDPWSQDLVFRSLNDKKTIEKAAEEEAHLLQLADQIIYVSPITLAKQKELFKESSNKMSWFPVPTYYTDKKFVKRNNPKPIWGYYGDYSSAIRNLEPFYRAAKSKGIVVNICGSSDQMYESTGYITVQPRLSLEELQPLEERTDILVFLCNLHGGQIPGKIYQYSATDKFILFILDGTEEEKKELKEYFGKFNRYLFCENRVESIEQAIDQIEVGVYSHIDNQRLDCFSPKNIVNQILLDEGAERCQML